MKLISELTDQAKQSYTLVGENGELIDFLLTYSPVRRGWFFNLTYNDKIINGKKLSNYPNLLRNYKNILPFGLLVDVTDFEEPYRLDDFVTGRVKVYLLNENDVKSIEEELFE